MEGVDSATKELFKYLQLKEGGTLDKKPIPILTSECQSGWAKAKKRIYSAISEGTYF